MKKIVEILAITVVAVNLSACVSTNDESEISDTPEFTENSSESDPVEDYQLEGDQASANPEESVQQPSAEVTEEETAVASDISTEIPQIASETAVDGSVTEPVSGETMANTETTGSELPLDIASTNTDTSSDAADPEAVAAVSSTSLSHVVVIGDTLSAIAEKLLGSAYKWKELADMNQISNPHLIFPGQTINVNSAQVSQL